jgi:hydrogenase maturation protease
MDERREVLVMGIGNVLWADEGFGVRAVEALHEAFAFPPDVMLMDGGTLGLNLFEPVASARRVLLFDAIDFALAPGTLRIVMGPDIAARLPAKLSPHQTGFTDVLALARLSNRTPDAIVVVGVQPVDLADFGGSLTPAVKARVPEAVAIAAEQLARWGFTGTARTPGESFEPLHATSLALDPYETGRPAAEEACRVGDERVLRLRQD